LSAILIFAGAWLVLGILLVLILPKTWSRIWINFGLFTANVPALLAFIPASMAATHSFRASLRRKICKKDKENKGKEEVNEPQRDPNLN